MCQHTSVVTYSTATQLFWTVDCACPFTGEVYVLDYLYHLRYFVLLHVISGDVR